MITIRRRKKRKCLAQEEIFDSLWTHKTISEMENRDFTKPEFAITGIFTDQGRAQYDAQACLISPCSNSAGLRGIRDGVALLLLSITLVIAFEIMNSAIENVVDLASNLPFLHVIKNAKDMVAGAVLVGSGFALTGL